MSTAVFRIRLWRQAGQDQIALLAEQDIATFMPHNEGRSPASGLATCRFKRLPDAITSFEVQTAKFPVTVGAIDVVAINDRCADQAMQCLGQFFVLPMPSPGDSCLWAVLSQFQEH